MLNIISGSGLELSYSRIAAGLRTGRMTACAAELSRAGKDMERKLNGSGRVLDVRMVPIERS